MLTVEVEIWNLTKGELKAIKIDDDIYYLHKNTYEKKEKDEEEK